MSALSPSLLCLLSLCLLSAYSYADANKAEDKEESPWLATPTFSADPKMGTSIGAMGAYVFKADADSPSSMLGAMASYSSTDSTLLALFSRNYFGADSHRLVAGAAIGRIENDYSDFLGTGLHIKTTDELSGQAVRYSTRVLSDWFVGAQLVNMDYQITGSDAETQDYLESIGLTGFASTGVGIVTQRDTRDNQNSPRKGSEFKLNNIAYRESLGGDASFDVYDMSFTTFHAHGNQHVLAAKVSARVTNDAPVGAYSSVSLRGYTYGEYLAPHNFTLQVEERIKLKGKWGLSGFVGLACLYGDRVSCGDDESLYPAAGVGVNYLLKLEEKMIVRAEIAAGKYDSHGLYIQFGNAF